MRSRRVLIAYLVLLGLVVAGCTGTDTAKPTNQPTTTILDDTPIAGGRMVVGIDRDPGVLNPAVTADLHAHVVSEPMFNGLVRLTIGQAPEPELAESWTVDQGGRSYSFKLRPGVSWHDGRPLTSDDVKFSFEDVLLRHHPRTGPSLAAAAMSIETPSVDTVVFSFPEPYGVLLQQLNVTEAPILPRHVYGSCTDPTTVAGCPANDHPVGSGPFMFGSRSPEQVQLIRNPAYFRAGQPYLDELLHRIIAEPGDRTAALRAGELDWLWDTPEADLRDIRNDTDTFRVGELGRSPAGGHCMSTMAFNVNPPEGRPRLLADVRTRQALWAATDRYEATPDTSTGAALVSGQPIHSRISVSKATRLNIPPTDPERSELLLTRIGWVDQGGARVARGVAGVPDGTLLRLEAHAAGPRQVRYAEKFKEQWASIGVEVVVIDGGAEVPSRVWMERQFDLAFVLSCHEVDPVLGVRPQYVTPEIGTGPRGNLAGYSSPEMDDLWVRVTREIDPAQRQQLFQKIQELAVEDLPYMWIAEFPTLLSWNQACFGFNFGNAGLYVETTSCRPKRAMPTSSTTTTTLPPTPP